MNCSCGVDFIGVFQSLDDPSQAADLAGQAGKLAWIVDQLGVLKIGQAKLFLFFNKASDDVKIVPAFEA